MQAEQLATLRDYLDQISAQWDLRLERLWAFVEDSAEWSLPGQANPPNKDRHGSKQTMCVNPESESQNQSKQAAGRIRLALLLTKTRATPRLCWSPRSN